MKIYLKTLLFSLSAFLLASMDQWKEEVYIWFPQELGIVAECAGKEAEISFEIYTESARKIQVHSFSLAGCDFTIYKDDKLISASDTLILNEKSPLKLKVKFPLNSKKPGSLIFKTDVKKFTFNRIHLVYGEYHISAMEIRNVKSHHIIVTESCKDSVNVFFPYGGTISSVMLFKDSSEIFHPYRSISYEYGEEANSMTFSKADQGKYFVRFRSCHWGDNFWLTIQ